MGTVRTFNSVVQKRALAYLYPQPGQVPQNLQSLSTFVLQYWPETLSDNQSANYNSIDVPGGSHPIVQWINNGARQLSFRSQFVHEQINPDGTRDATSRYNVDIDAAIAHLRFFMYPHYERRGEILTSPPPLLYLVLGKHNLRHRGVSSTARGQPAATGIPVVLLNVGVEYSSWHADGTPRMAAVDFQFQEVVQNPATGVRFVDREDFRAVMRGYSHSPLTRSQRAG